LHYFYRRDACLQLILENGNKVSGILRLSKHLGNCHVKDKVTQGHAELVSASMRFRPFPK